MTSERPRDGSALSWRPRHRRFQGLMPYRIHEILLVSSAYDAYVLEEDGSINDKLFSGYSELSLSSAPRLTHAPTAWRALDAIAVGRFDLVITVGRIDGTDPEDLARQIKVLRPELPVILLVFDEAELAHLEDGALPQGIDRVFQWTGSEGTLIAAIKLVEDSRNVAHDTELASVQVLLVVEDRVRSYSSFLALLYQEILEQSGSLVDEGLNDFHRSMRLRSRPKILLARNYEEAEALYARHRGYISSLLSDVRIPRAGKPHPSGGLELARAIRKDNPDLPILFQSSEPHQGSATQLGAWFVDKNSAHFRSRVRRFLAEAIGFGPFVFRLPDRTEVGRAANVFEMEEELAHVPDAAIAYHASHNHFSTWIRARNLAEAADRIRAWSLDDFEDIPTLREAIVEVLRKARVTDQEGAITDLYKRDTGPDNRFVRVGRGSVGGKGRGIAFMSSEIVRHGLLDRYPDLQIRIPKTVVLGSKVFDTFMDHVDLENVEDIENDDEVTGAVLAGAFPEAIVSDLRKAFANLKGPIAVRSSSLLEDSRFQPFAGVYATYMLPNIHPDAELRFRELLRAIKLIYASTYWRDARTYMAGTPHDVDDQKMAVIIQQVVGTRFADRCYPVMSGVVLSHNDYPVAPQTAAGGVARVALGLGHTVVGGGVALRFSPATPQALPQFPDAESMADGTQRQFLALDLSRPELAWEEGRETSLVRCDLSQAEEDGMLELVGSVYSPADDVIREGLHNRGPRVVTFNNILKYNSLPVATALLDIVDVLRRGIGEEVEVEFALDLKCEDDGRPSLSCDARLYVLQVRPMSTPENRALLQNLDDVADDDLVARSDVALGHGSHTDIVDIVWLEVERLGFDSGRRYAGALARLDAELRERERPYVLIGPGRWGSSDPTLGVGVRWSDICGARVIVECPIGTRRVEPSQGTHFFRNITAAHVGYVTVTATDTSWISSDWLTRAWRNSGSRSLTEDGALRHIELIEPLGVHIDGKRGAAVIVQRAADYEPIPVPPIPFI